VLETNRSAAKAAVYPRICRARTADVKLRVTTNPFCLCSLCIRACAFPDEYAAGISDPDPRLSLA